MQLLFLLTAQHSLFLKSCCPRENQRWLFGGITGTWLVLLPTRGWPAQSLLLLTVQWIFHISISHRSHQYCIQVMPDPVCWDYSGFLCCLQSTCKSSPLGNNCIIIMGVLFTQVINESVRSTKDRSQEGNHDAFCLLLSKH